MGPPRRRWRWALAAVACAASEAGPPAAAARAPRARGAPLLWEVGGPPVRSEGRYVVSSTGERIKWACVNWYGPQSEKYVVGGLEVAPLGEIVERIVAFGFNCVRLPYCTQAHVDNPVVQDEDVFANPQFQGGRRFLEVWDATVEALTSAGLMVIINNHLHVCGWCCYYAQDEGLWYVPGFPESVWIESLVNMTERHQNDSMVVAMDLRNEVHDYEDTWLTWGDGNEKTDWAAAATRAGNAVLRANSNMLIVVMALCSGMDLRGAIDSPINLSVSRRLVYQSHNYVEFQWWAYVSANVVSWKTVQVASAFAGLLFSFATWLLLRAWRALAMPRPPRSAWLAVAGAWWLAACALCAGGAGAIWLVMTRFCTFWARRDVLPAIVSSCALASVGVALLGAACLDARAARRGSAAPARKVAAAVGELVAARPAPFALGRARPGSGMDDLAATPARPEQVVLEVPSACRQQPAGAPAVCCEPGCSACGLAWARPARPCGGREELQPPPWDCGLCCGLQCLVLSASLAVVCAGLFVWACMAPSYWLMQQHLDNMWGFALQPGYDYTAPVWMGEFGTGLPSNHWLHFSHYLAARDVDFAYWALNGKKWADGYIDINTGDFIRYAKPRWEQEWFGILEDDYRTVRHPWLLMDLQALAAAPKLWGDARPCDREALGPSCGG